MSFTEESTVQRGLLDLLKNELGWKFVSGRDLDRSPDSPFIEAEVAAALRRMNPAIDSEPTRLDEIIPKLRLLTFEAHNDGLVSANERMFTWMRGSQVVRFQGMRNLTPIQLVEFDTSRTADLNSFIVSDEVAYGSPGRLRRFDLVLWINGFPVAVGETKSPVSRNASWLDAAHDISSVYEKDAAPFFVPNILSFATEGREFHYGAIGQRPEHWSMWGSTQDPEDLGGWPRVLRSASLLLRPEVLLQILRSYSLFERRPTGRVKLIPRYPQVEAVEAILERVNLEGRRQGLVWHYQGTGKTLLIAFAALRLLNERSSAIPTVIIVLDRVDLVEQTVRQFQTVGMPRLRVAGSGEDLRGMLAEDHRGVIVTTVFKFAGAPTLNMRGDIVVFIDEAHRSQEGILGADLRRALPNAQFFGLTGTPIVDSERDTFNLFGDSRDVRWVLNEYSMSRAITDGTSVPIHLESRLADYQIDAATLDIAFAEMASEEALDDEGREALASRAASARTIFANPSRVRVVCNDIVDHFLSRVAPLGLKAQVVAYNRELCVRYFDELSRELRDRGRDQEHEVAVVMTVGTTKDEPREWRDRFGLDAAGEARVKARFNSASDRLSLLVVTSKLLTGFDAPIEGAMYLDRPLRRHTLFQAVCRTNRRFTNPVSGQEKSFGLVVDYVGLATAMVAALRSADPSDRSSSPMLVDELADETCTGILELVDYFGSVDLGDISFEALSRVQELVPPGPRRDEFGESFVAIQRLWEFLFPHERLRELRDEYRWLARVYTSVAPLSLSNSLIWHRLGAKTQALVDAAISEMRVSPAGIDEVIVDAETLAALARLREEPDENPREVSVEAALETIQSRIDRRLRTAKYQTVYVALSERLERLRRIHLERAQSSIEFLRELLDLARSLLEAEHSELVRDPPSLLPDRNKGALTQILAEYAPEQTPEIVRAVVSDIDAIVRQVRFAGWTTSQPGDRSVRLEVRRVLRRHGLETTGDVFDRTYAYIRENY